MSESGDPPRIRISPDELATAVPPLRPSYPLGPPRLPPQVKPSHLAVSSLVLALIGVPLVGCLLGPIAILCATLAISAIHNRDDLRGMGMAMAGLALGIVEFVGWLIALAILLSHPAGAPGALAPPFLTPAHAPLGIDEAPPHIQRALKANALVTCQSQPGETHLGSGVLVGRHGDRELVVTNRHVAQCAMPGSSPALHVTLGGPGPRPAELLWVGPDQTDLAVLGVRLGAPAEVEPVPLRVGVAARIGDAVFAVGNPLGYQTTYTVGAVSAVRSVLAGSHRLRVYQVQAALNQGNSGGGLYTAQGELLAINTWTTEKSVSEGIGFAIAASDLVELVRESDEPWSRELVKQGQAASETSQ
jgi:S1-C subfamily serine protease